MSYIVYAIPELYGRLAGFQPVRHSDCFQPVGNDKAIIYKNGFREEADYSFSRSFEKKIYFISQETKCII
jgi:hypothetical protein